MTELASAAGASTRGSNRRQLLARAGMIGAAAVGASLLGSRQQTTADATEVALFKGTNGRGFKVNPYDILNFALNLEYLEAEFYLLATTGSGLPDALTGANPGAVTGGAQVPFADPAVASFAAEIAADELHHVSVLRTILGPRAVSRPAIDFTNAFTAAATDANAITSGQTFNPFDNDDDFLLGAFLFEDVGVTAYHGAIPYIASNALLSDTAGILAVEAYHAGAIRATLYSRGQTTATDISTANAIAALREQASDAQAGPNPSDSPLSSTGGSAILAPSDSTSIAFSRTFAQVLNIVYLNPTATLKVGGFFPAGLNGRIA